MKKSIATFVMLLGFSLVAPLAMAQQSGPKQPDIPPRYKAGQAKMAQVIQQNLVIPEEAKQKGITGSVLVGFYVESDGQVTQIQVLDSLGAGCDAEAVRVVGLLTDWLPGRQKHKPVRVQIQLPISFADTQNLQVDPRSGSATKKGQAWESR